MNRSTDAPHDPALAPETAVAGVEPAPAPMLRVAAMGDLHVGETHVAPYAEIFAEASAEADVLVLCGDLTNYGKPVEAEILARDLEQATIPVVGVLGNHDYECGHCDEVRAILKGAGMSLLDGDAIEIGGVGFGGCKGAIGGFGRYMLSAFGEREIKDFVQAAVDENLKLEQALRVLRTERTVAVLHYSPVPDTLEGEPPEIFAFLGSSRLAETIDRYDNVKLALHGHAHRGTFAGATPRGVPVRNVAQMICRAETGKSYAVFEV
jgi:Icc-related predicted phosphoesterase